MRRRKQSGWAARFGAAAALGVWVACSVACLSGGEPTQLQPGGDQEPAQVADPEIVEAMGEIEPTQITPSSAAPPLISDLQGAGTPLVDAGDGVQILQVAPMGAVRAATQVGVIFDRPMVALSHLDDMNASVPIHCEAEGVTVPMRGRWAGTSTAVLLPDTDNRTLPLATAFECVIEAGIQGIDGVALENEVRWSFETPRPKVRHSVPRHKSARVVPDAPITVHFDQPMDLASARDHIRLSDERGAEVRIEVVADPDTPEAVRVLPQGMVKDAGYTLTASEGMVGRLGPLPMTIAYSASLRTYPPLRLEEYEPTEIEYTLGRISLKFSTPVPYQDVAKLLTIDPLPSEGWTVADSEWTSLYWNHVVDLDPQTEYTLTLAPGLTDEFGQVMDEGFSWKVRTQDHQPWLNISERMRVYPATNPLALPFRQLNVGTLEGRFGAFPIELVASSKDASFYRDVLGTGALPWQEVSLQATPNVMSFESLDLAPWLNDEGYGLVGYQLSSPRITDHKGERRLSTGAVLVTDLGGTLKVSPGAVELWVTRLSDGEPVQEAEVDFYVGARRVGSGSTDAQGLARFEGEPGPSWRSWHNDQRVVAIVRKGADTSFVQHNWSDGISPYGFRLWGPHGWWRGFDADGRHEVAHHFTDRGVYRPGDEVFGRITYRSQTARGLEIPTDVMVVWEFQTPDGDTLIRDEGPLDARGGFDLKVQIPEDGAFGEYTLALRASGEEFHHTEWIPVSAQAYRAPAFRVSVDGPAEAIAGEELVATTDARYLFGAPLSQGSVIWRTWTSPRTFQPEGFEGFAFGPEWDWEWETEYSEGGNQYQTRIEGELEEGRHTLAQVIPAGEWDRPVSWTMEAEVTDIDRQAIADRVSVWVHPAAWYLGLRTTQRLPRVGEGVDVEVIGVLPDGSVHGGDTAEVKLYRRTWDRVRQQAMGGTWSWSYERVDTEVQAEQVRLGSKAQVVRFPLEKTGQYVIIATSKDAQGNTVQTSDSFFAVGSGFVSWALPSENQMELVPDKELYRPGDTAKILVQSPRPGMKALVSLEREGVLWRDVVTLEGTSSVVEVPITEAHRPNVFVSVVAVTGAPPQVSPDQGRPEVRVGMAELTVDTEETRLQVAVRSDEEVYRPQDEVSVTVEVRQSGEPVPNAGVTLYAVDESILSLTGYRTPQQHGTYYQKHNLSVMTADSRVNVLDRAPYLVKGANRGGGGGDGFGDVDLRSEFLTTIAWEPDLKTDRNGLVRHTFKLPDNLTTFRIMAVVDSGAEAFGSADQEIRVTRPIIARPAMPRFFRVGDSGFAGVVIHNNTDATRSVDVTAELEGPGRLSGSPVWVSVPAHGAVEVPFRIEAQGVGEAQLRFQAISGSERDAVAWSLPIIHDPAWDTVGSTGSTLDEATEQIARPDGAVPGQGGLKVDVATTVLVGAGEGLDYLNGYAHDSVELRSSRAIGALYSLQVREAAGVEMTEAALRETVESALRALPEFEHHTGGLSYWRGQSYPSVMGTAYALELMGRAQEAGFQVDAAGIQRYSTFLREVLAGKHMVHWDALIQLNARAHVGLALARVGQGDAGHNNNMYAQRSDLSVWALASLMEAIYRTTGPDARVDELERLILSRAFIEAASASVKENQSRRWLTLWGSDELATAAVLESLLVVRGEHPLAERFARFLSSERRHGFWRNTRATAAVLASLARYSKAYESSGQRIQAEVRLAGTSMLQTLLEVPESAGLEVAMDDLSDGELQLLSDGGRLYYDARLRYVPQRVEARDEGFTLTRSYEILEGGGGAGQVTSGALLQVTLQVVTPIQRHGVAIVDPLPAGLEPVLSSLATSSQAPVERAESYGDDELPRYGKSWAFNHHEIRDDQVRVYASRMPPGIHTWRYVVRATTPGHFDHPAASVEEMYEPENFGRTGAGVFTVGRGGR